MHALPCITSTYRPVHFSYSYASDNLYVLANLVFEGAQLVWLTDKHQETHLDI